MSYLSKKFKYFAEIESESITVERLTWTERSKARTGTFTFWVDNPSTAVKAKLQPGKTFDLWADFVAKASWNTAVKGDLQKFKGRIKNVKITVPAPGRLYYEVEGADNSARAHDFVVNDSYTAQRPDQIVTDAWTNYGPSGVTFTNVATAGFTIDSVKFPHDSLFDLMEQMADATGWIWRLDENDDLHFKPPGDDLYGTLQDTDAYVKGTVVVTKDASQLANRVWVFGSVSESDELTEKWVGNAQQHTFPVAYQPTFSSIAVRKGGVAQTVGRDGVDTFATHNVLVNVESQVLRFDPSSPPGSSVLVEMDYTYGTPVIARREDSASISTYGLHEYVIVDSKITDVSQASGRAKAHIREHANPTTYVEGQVYVFDVRAGQQVRAVHSDLELDGYYTVDEIDREILGPEEAVVTLKVRASPEPPRVEAKFQEIDRRLHALETKDIPEDAPVNVYESVSDTFNITDSTPTMTYAAPVTTLGSMQLGYSQLG